MNWSCPVCQKDFSRKDNMQRHMNRKHSNFAPVIPMSQEKCQWFKFEHPFTCMVAGMTGSGKTVWVHSLLTQAYRMINDSLVLLTVAARLYGNASHPTKHRICQGNPHGFRTRCLF